MPEMMEAPKYSVCFSDLADYLNLKDEVQKRVKGYDSEDKSLISLQHKTTENAENRQTPIITEEPIGEATPQNDTQKSPEFQSHPKEITSEQQML